MPSVIRAAEFFVVGGPVGPEHACYIARAADAELAAAVRARRLCLVLGPPASGKTSLLARAAHMLRKTGARVARIELGELPAGGGAEQWLRGFAAHTARALGLDVDVDAWWAAHEPPLGESKLAEFFADRVLGTGTAPVVVLVDDAEALLDAPWHAEFLDAITSSYARRAADARFGRLTFVLAGCASRRHLLGAAREARWEAVTVVEPADFSAEEAYGLAAALGGETILAQALVDRIWAWTRGQPYLTQKVARGVARKGGRLEDVERVVREQVLAPELAADPVLGALGARLTGRSRPARRAARLVARLAAGKELTPPRDPAVWDELWLAGAARTEDGRLRLRNRIVKEVAVARWLKPARSSLRIALAAVALAIVVAMAGFWYVRYLPEGDIATLTDAEASLTTVEAAYRRLRDLPGFTERADALWRSALERQSRAATTLAAAAAVDGHLRALPGAAAGADVLLAEFWLRRARAAAHAEEREAAVLLAQRAAQLPGAEPVAAAALAELVGEDYAQLQATLRLAAAPAAWRMAFDDALLLTLDAERNLRRTPFGAAPGAPQLGAAPVRLTGLGTVGLVREIEVEGDGTAGEFVLSLAVAHPATGELLVTLTAPSGEEAVLALPVSAGGAAETFEFQASQGSPLDALTDEGQGGTWRVTVVDRVAGNAGALLGLGLAFAEIVARDEPPEPIAIPDPARVEDVELRVEGSRALVWPRQPASVGAVSLWNLATGALEHDLTLPTPPRDVALNARHTRVLAATPRSLVLWDVATGAVVGRAATQTELVLPPVFSTDGGYVAIAERVDGASPLYSVLRSDDAALVASIEGPSDAQGWELGPGARYFALRTAPGVVRIIDARSGQPLREIALERGFERLLHRPDGRAVLTVDARGDIAAWSLEDVRTPARSLGRTAAAASVSLDAGGTRLAFTRGDGAVVVVDPRTTDGTVAVLREPRAMPATLTALAADGSRLATQSGSTLRLWVLPARAAAPAGGRLDAAPTALALDAAGDVLAVGFASGQVRFGTAAAVVGPGLAAFGHRGPVTAVAVRAALGVAVTGGRDGFVRFWDIASGEPTGVVVQSAAEPIAAVALRADGRYVASAAARVVRVADATGVVRLELPFAGGVTALAFAPSGNRLAVADGGGRVMIASLDSAGERAVLEVGEPVTALAFTADGERLVVGDAAGDLGFVAAASGAARGDGLRLAQPPRWLAVSEDGGTLLAATDAWLHALAIEPKLAPRASRPAVLPAALAAFAATPAGAVRAAGVTESGTLVVATIEADSVPRLAAPPGIVDRDWAAVLGVRLDAEGNPGPYAP